MYQKYIIKNGKKVGPYCYTTVRGEDGSVKTVYLGHSPEERRKHTPKDNILLALAIIFIVAGFFVFNHDISSDVSSSLTDIASRLGSTGNLVTGAFVLGPQQMQSSQAGSTEQTQAHGPGQPVIDEQFPIVGNAALSENQTIVNGTTQSENPISIALLSAITKSLNITFNGSAEYSLRLPEGAALLSAKITGNVEGLGVGEAKLQDLIIVSWNLTEKRGNVTALLFNESCAGTCSMNISQTILPFVVTVNGSATFSLESLHLNLSVARQISPEEVTLERPQDASARKKSAAAKKEARKSRKGIVTNALESAKGMPVERGPDWMRECNGPECQLTLFSSAVHVRDIDGRYKPLTEAVSLEKLDERTLHLKWKDYDLNITVSNSAGGDLPGLATNISDNIIDYEFIYSYRLPSLDTKPAITIQSNKEIVSDGKNLYLDEVALSFEDAINLNSFNVSLEKIDGKNLRMRLSKNYAAFQEGVDDTIEIDPTIKLTGGNNTYDGDVDDGGTLVSTGTTMRVGIDPCAILTYRSFIDWNTTLIPDSATITRVNLTINVESIGDEGTYSITDLGSTAQSQSGDPVVLYADLELDAYVSADTSGGTTSFLLGSVANNNLKQGLAANTFSTGIRTTEVGGLFCGEALGHGTITTIEGATAANRPILTVTYTAPPTMTGVMVNSTDVTKNDTNQNLTIVLAGVNDVDGDPIFNITDWRINGTSLAILNLPFDTNITSIAGGAVRSYSSFAYNGTLGSGVAANVPQWNNSCIRGGCYSFDGSNDYINFTANITLGKEFTIVAWILPYNYSNIEEIAANSAGGSSTDGFRFDVNDWQTNNRRIVLETGNGATGSNAQTNTGIAGFGVWNHVAVVVNRTAGTARIYVNGTDVTSSQTILTNFKTSGPIQIGIMSDLNFPFKGSIDEFQIYNRSLSSGQIALLYSNSTVIHNSTIGSEIGNLFSACVTPNDLLGDGTTVCSNNLTILAVSTHPPNATLIVPINATTFFTIGGNITLNGTVFDNGAGDSVRARIYVANASYLTSGYPQNTFLVSEWNNVVNGTSLQYNLTALPIQDENPASKGALLIYHFDNTTEFGEAQFGRAYDFSGNGRNTTTGVGGIIFPRRGKFAGGMQPSVALAADAGSTGTSDLVGIDNLTYLAWVNTTSLVTSGTAGGYIISKFTATFTQNRWSGFAIRQDDTNISLFFNGTKFTYPYFFNSTNVYYHLAVVLYRNKTFNIYRDGQLFATSGYPTFNKPDTTPFIVGAWFAAGIGEYVGFFPGVIDDVAVFNRSFTSQEVLDVAQLRNDTYYWYMDLLDNGNPKLNGTSPVWMFTLGTSAAPAQPDTTPPSWYNVTVNSTSIITNQWVMFNTTWTDNTALHGFIFSINQSAVFVNSSYIRFAGTWNISFNVSQITAPNGFNFSWRFFANDTSGNWNITSTQSFIVNITLYAPNATLYKPNNATVFREVGNITLNGTVTDDNGDRMTFVRMYASRYFYPNGTWLAQEWLDVLNGTSLQYNITSVPVQDDDPQSSGALLIFHFDNQSDYGEPQFGRIYDFSGNNLNATANSNIYPGRGKMGGGLDVNSNSLGANVSNTEYMIGKKNITYLAWVNTSTLTPGSTNRAILDKHDGTSGFSVRQPKLAATLSFIFDATTVTTASNFFSAANIWYHLAVVLHAAGTFEVYRDGVFFYNGTYASISSNNNHFSIGSSYNGATHGTAFAGTIDDVAVFNRSLSAEEIMNIAKLKSGTYYWYLNMTDNSTSALNGGSPVRTFIVNRYPNITNFSLTPSPANTTNQFICTFIILDDETSTMIADIDFLKNSVAMETYTGGSFNNGTVYTQTATSGLQAKGESWQCRVTNIADNSYLTHGLWDGATSTPVTVVNTPPSQPVLLEPAHGNFTTNIRPRFRWTASDADNDSLNFTLRLTCYNGTSLTNCPLGGDDRNITLINTNDTYLTADLRFYKDDNFYYNWTVNVTDGDNATNFTRPNNFSEVVVVDISMHVLNVSFGTKVLNDQDDTLDNSPYPLKIRNGGNARINLDLLFGPTDLLFTQSGRPAWSYQFAVNETNDCGPSTTCASPVFNYNAINKTLSTTTLANVAQGTYTSVVKFLNFSASSNLTALHFNITVPPSETAGDKRSLITITASYGGYI